MVDQQSLKNIEDLHRLKTEGIITEEEFERSKQKILFGGRPATAPVPGESTRPEEEDHIAWVLLALKRYADFQGRSSRKEFWMFQLLYVAIFVIASVFVALDTDPDEGFGALAMFAVASTILALLGLLVPLIAVQVRRFHDQDMSGWFAALNLIPYVGGIVVYIMMLLEGTKGENRFGPDPTSP